MEEVRDIILGEQKDYRFGGGGISQASPDGSADSSEFDRNHSVVQ